MEFTESKIWFVERVLPNVPTVALTDLQLTSWNQVMSISFDPLKEASDCKRFAADSDVKRAVNSLLQTRETNFYYLFYFGLRTLVAQLAYFLTSMVTTWKSDVYYLLLIDLYVFRLKTKFSA